MHTDKTAKRQGEVIVVIKYKDYQMEAHLPVDGKIKEVNETFISGNPNLLLQHAEKEGWVALIVPSHIVWVGSNSLLIR